MIANSVVPVPLPDGIYCGTWKGWHVSIFINSETQTFKVDKVLLRKEYPCIIVIKDKIAIVDSGNPIQASLFNLFQMSEAFTAGVIAANRRSSGLDFETEENYFKRKYGIDL